MGTRVKFVAVSLVVGIIAAALTRVIWPLPSNGPALPAGLLPWLVALDVMGALLFGVGVAFVVFGYPLVRRAGQSGLLTGATYVSIAFQLLSWWPHGSLHEVIGSTFPIDFNKLLYLDYGFHLPLIATALIITYFFARTLTVQRAAEPSSRRSSASRPAETASRT